MKVALDLHDIQGNIVFGYGRWGYPLSRYLLFKFNNGSKARKFVTDLVPLVTSSAPLDKQNDGTKPPPATTNIALTYAGLTALGLPDESMRSFPEDFRMGMKARKDILGDDGASAPENWDPVWQDHRSVHMLVTINGQLEKELDGRYEKIIEMLENTHGGVILLQGHRGSKGADDLPYQSGNAIILDGKPTANEHFHYTDGISDPVFKGQGRSANETIGAGKPTRESAATPAGWDALETGEFLLGHRDETCEYPIAPVPRLLSYNGSFMVYRKLHQNVGKFTDYIKKASVNYGDPQDSPEVKQETMKAKFAGRWSNGAPLATYPDYASAMKFGEEWDSASDTLYSQSEASPEQKSVARAKLAELKIKRRAFDYNGDIKGASCPLGAHTRRTNPRGSLEFDVTGAFNTPGALVDRRRILRRGLPYGESSDRNDNDGDHGIIFMAINSSIQRQFEFVQQQWVNYGNDFKLANEKDALLGNHATDDQGNPIGRTVINGNEVLKQPTYMCSGMPRFVETRGGDYFFIPSMTALRMIGEGIIDPT
ncbi:MAG: Dyp-type peroxidase family [Paraglaciecola sp.]|jgi:Dyp-type peroxidase family